MFHGNPVWQSLCFGLCLFLLAGCDKDMADQPHYEPLEASAFFADGQASRPLVAGTVPRGHLRIDQGFFTGTVNGQPVRQFPQEKVAQHLKFTGSDEEQLSQIMRRGRQRFDIFCAACHDRTGSGQGMVVQRGFPPPPSFHIERLRTAPAGHFYDVITQGFGRMPSHADQIPPADRWAIVAYVWALQFSQHARATDLEAADRRELSKRGETP